MRSVVESHPFLWKVGNVAAMNLSFLLPHDKSYKAIRYFIKNDKDGLFLDIGANNGISILSFRSQCKHYKILSLEPNKLLEPDLALRKASDPLVDFQMVGAGAAEAFVTFYTPVYKGIVLHAATSADESQVRHVVEKFFGRSIANRIQIRPFQAKVISVDSLNLRPDIIKIDAEGFDLDVLLGAQKTLALARPFVMVEVEWQNKEKMFNFFDNIKYSMYMFHVDKSIFEYLDLTKATPDQLDERNYFAIPRERLSGIPVL